MVPLPPPFEEEVEEDRVWPSAEMQLQATERAPAGRWGRWGCGNIRARVDHSRAHGSRRSSSTLLSPGTTDRNHRKSGRCHSMLQSAHHPRPCSQSAHVPAWGTPPHTVCAASCTCTGERRVESISAMWRLAQHCRSSKSSSALDGLPCAAACRHNKRSARWPHQSVSRAAAAESSRALNSSASACFIVLTAQVCGLCAASSGRRRPAVAAAVEAAGSCQCGPCWQALSHLQLGAHLARGWRRLAVCLAREPSALGAQRWWVAGRVRSNRMVVWPPETGQPQAASPTCTAAAWAGPMPPAQARASGLLLLTLTSLSPTQPCPAPSCFS